MYRSAAAVAAALLNLGKIFVEPGNKLGSHPSKFVSAKKCDVYIAEILQLCYISQQDIDGEKGLRYSTHRGKGRIIPESQN